MPASTNPGLVRDIAPTRRELAWLGLAIVVYWFAAWTASKNLPAVADEIAHVTGGASYWRDGINHLQPENGYTAMHWATLPMLWHPPAFPNVPPDLPEGSAMIVIGHRLFYESGNNPEAMLATGRALMAIVGAALVALIWWWARRLWSANAGMLAAGLAAFCPTLLAHGGLVMSDMMLSFFLLLTLTAYWTLLQRASLLRIFGVGLCAGCLLLSKMSGVLALPMMAALALLRLGDAPAIEWRFGLSPIRAEGRRKLAIIVASSFGVAIVAGGVLWAAFGFHYSMFAHPAAAVSAGMTTWDTLLRDGGLVPRVVAVLRAGRVLPEAWLYGLAQTAHTLPGRLAFLNGETSDHGWPSYFPYAWLVKTPLTLFALMAVGIAASSRGGKKLLLQAAPLLVLFVVYWLFALTTHINIGHRHLLPVYAPMLILAGAAAQCFTAGPRWTKVLVPVLAVWFAAESLWIRPRYLSYFNALAGGPANGYRHLVDSNVDAGQDLIELRRWLDAHGGAETKPTAPLFLSYFGPADPVHHGIRAVRFADNGFDARPRSLPAPIRGGRFCISVTLFQGMYTLTAGAWTPALESIYAGLLRADPTLAPTVADAKSLEHLQFARLRHYLATAQPEARIGDSILIFKLSDDEVARVLYAPWAEVERTMARRGAELPAPR